MTRRQVVAICCGVLMLGSSMLAQSKTAKAAKADPITGSWTGELVLTDGQRHMPIKMELKADGKGAVTGTVEGLPSPADVKAGTYDTKTSAVKLQLGKVGNPTTLLTLEGKVAKGTATGTFTGDERGTFTISKKG